jgi:predicted nucleic acid-binding protein
VSFFLDSSALVKRYVKESGSVWVASLLDGKRPIYVARISGVEVVAALVRRGKSSHVSPRITSTALRRFRLGFQSQFLLVPITPRIIDNAMNLAKRHGLRGYDAVQLAAAIAMNGRLQSRGRTPLTFVSADVELNAAAALQGLAIDDPNSHP